MKRSITLFCTLLLLIVSAVPAFAGKVLAEIEYFYSDDGTLTGKAFNGKRVNFEYDLRGQLLAVKDAQDKDLERYTYDPAGNRLSKTINGVTTTYTYDKANQLVTSTVNGKTTRYKYDAAGRMIQAGDKSYIYNGQNKVTEVRQNGKIVAKFEYNIDGQIAKAIYGNKVEEFIWDGLALIWRSGVTYINEPYVTGGNPVMAGDDVLFNDMLGSTLAVNGNAIEMTSFGETADKNAFFTGKPMIDELGYSFLFRDYNPNQGKWTTTDPLGYPDGWNNLAYVNNGVSNTIDNYGTTQHQLANGNFSTNTPGVYSYSMNFSAASLLTTYGWYNRNDTSVPFIFSGQMEPYGGYDIIGNYKVFDDGSVSLLGDIIDYNWSGDIINDDPYDNQSFSTHGNISVYFSIGSSPIFSGEIETGINYRLCMEILFNIEPTTDRDGRTITFPTTVNVYHSLNKVIYE
ncbi:MAG: hypothetical protein J6C40_05515 [Lentisphaeria bacterium]|nr:hypothetical protein [Lentisphaeria bacterium]